MLIPIGWKGVILLALMALCLVVALTVPAFAFRVSYPCQEELMKISKAVVYSL